MPQRFFEIAPALCRRLQDLGLDNPGLRELLGEDTFRTLYRRFPGAVQRVVSDSRIPEAQRHALAFLFLHQSLDKDCLELVFGGLLSQLIDVGFIQYDADSGKYCCTFDVRSVDSVRGDDALGWVFSDMDSSVSVPKKADAETVPGIGRASYSLLGSVPQDPVERLLDLGCGSGVLSIATAQFADSIVATDISERALDFARASAAGSGIENIDFRQGSWFEPVTGELFDRIIANPPFVIGPETIHHVYRDAGLTLDEVSHMMVSQAPDFLHSMGTAHILASWVLQEGEDAAEKLGTWVPEYGVSALFVERARVSPSEYVQTWLEDESIDPRSDIGVTRTKQWLDYFEQHAVETIVMGFVALQKLSDATEPSEVNIQQLPSTHSVYFGDSVAAYFSLAAWLRTIDPAEALDSRYRIHPATVVSTSTSVQANESVRELSLSNGFGWSAPLDEAGNIFWQGLAPGTLTLRQVCSLFAEATSLSLETVEQQALAYLAQWVSFGFMIPEHFEIKEDA